MRFEIDGPNLTVMPDTPFLRNYPVDYVEHEPRHHRLRIGHLATGRRHDQRQRIDSQRRRQQLDDQDRQQGPEPLLETLVQNIKDILRETDKILPEGSRKRSSNRLGHKAPGNRAPAAGNAGAQHAGRAIDCRQSERSDAAERRHDRRQAHHVP